MFAGEPLSATSPPGFATPPTYLRTPSNPANAGIVAEGKKSNCASCGSGDVTGLDTGTLTMTISVPAAGTYLIPIEYVSGSALAKAGSVSVNGAVASTQTFPSSSADGQSVARLGVFANLNSGNNTIKFSQMADATFGVAGVETPILQP